MACNPSFYDILTQHQFIIFIVFNIVGAQLIESVQGKNKGCHRGCHVLESQSEEMRSCSFPFIYADKTYKTCTDLDDDNGQFWCSTKVDDSGVHIGGKGYWGYCEKWSYSISCKFGLVFGKIQSYLNNKLGVSDYCTEDEFSPTNVETYIGRETCPCKPLEQCPWFYRLQQRSEKLPKTNRLYKKIVKLIRNSVCDEDSKTVHCCDRNKDGFVPEITDFSVIGGRKEIQESGQWKPDVEEEECGQDLNLAFITCDDEDGCFAKQYEFPYMAVLGYDKMKTGKMFYLCGASIINKKYVLTAAHCHNKKRRDSKIREVVVGEYTIGEDPDCETCPPVQKFGVEKVILHENWDPNVAKKGFKKGFDIALVRLDGSIKLFSDEPRNSRVLPVCLPWKENDPELDTIKEVMKLTVTGWGKVTNDIEVFTKSLLDNSAGSRTLKKVELPLTFAGSAADKKCPRDGEEIQFCAGGLKGFDSCSGDSGGPVTYRKTPNSPWFQLGIVSYGSNKCGEKDRPGVYTRIKPFLPWIEANLEP